MMQNTNQTTLKQRRPSSRMIVLACLIASLLSVPLIAAEAGFQVVVNDSNAKTSVTTTELSRIFMKTLGRWDSGASIQPVDLIENSSVRAAFSKEIHGRSTIAIENHWVKMVFSGRSVPPPKFSSDEEILSFVRANPDAIGYIDTKTPIGDGVRVLSVEN